MTDTPELTEEQKRLVQETKERTYDRFYNIFQKMAKRRVENGNLDGARSVIDCLEVVSRAYHEK